MTNHHDQHNSNLCHSYSVISAFRQALIQLLKTFKNPKVKNIIQRINGNEQFSFNRMLSIFLGCVNPRSYLDPPKVHTASTEMVIKRLVMKTAFEIEGWKRLLPVREIFENLNLESLNF